MRRLTPHVPFNALWTLTTILLIRLVFAVLISVTFPVQMDAFSIAAPELVSCTGARGLRLGFEATLLR